jgi:hypothetical protein
MKVEVEIGEGQIAQELISWGEKKLLVFLQDVLSRRNDHPWLGYVRLCVDYEDATALIASAISDWGDDAPLCQLGECPDCGTKVAGWAKDVVCPICRAEVRLT